MTEDRTTAHTVGPVQTTAERDEKGRLVRITVDIHPTTQGRHLVDMVDSGVLAAFLAGLANPLGVGRHAGDVAAVLAATAGVRSLADLRLPRLALVARDRNGWSWRRVAEPLVISHVTVMRQVNAERRMAAEDGIWYDAQGMHGHDEDPATAGYSPADRVTLARALAYHRETTGRDWKAIYITPPAEITADAATTATVTPRDGGTPIHIVISTPARLVGGPADGETVAVAAGTTRHDMDAPDGAVAIYRPTDADHGVWEYLRDDR